MKKLVLLSIGIVALVTNALAQYTTNVLFTTFNDFSQFSGENGNTAAVTTAFDADGSTVNGSGNTGGTGTGGGSLQVNFQSGAGYNGVAFTASEANNQAFLSAIDPGQVGGVGVAYSGNLQITYSLPTPTSGGTYFQIGVNMTYAGDGYYHPIFSTSVTDLGYTDQYGQEVYLATIPYNITAGAFNGMGFNVDFNSDYAPALFPVFVDDITSITPAPEPGTMALMGMGALGLTFFARRRRA